MLYHVSPSMGLKTLYPHVSTHKKAYVYAIENMVTGLLFGTKMDDFDFLISTDDHGIPTVYECYPGAFQQIYQGKSCSVYVVEDTGFQSGLTSWSEELVCDTEVAVQEEIIINDLYEKLSEEEQQGNLKVYRYEFNDEYRKKISSHIVDRLIRFDVNLNECLDQDSRFCTYYRGIVENLLTIMDGHLLP